MSCLFPEEMADIKAGKCPFCHRLIEGPGEFRDTLSIKEHAISGLCQACQDRVFNEENSELDWEEDEDDDDAHIVDDAAACLD